MSQTMSSKERELQDSNKTVKEKEDILRHLQEEKEQLEITMKNQLACLHEMVNHIYIQLKKKFQPFFWLFNIQFFKDDNLFFKHRDLHVIEVDGVFVFNRILSLYQFQLKFKKKMFLAMKTHMS